MIQAGNSDEWSIEGGSTPSIQVLQPTFATASTSHVRAGEREMATATITSPAQTGPASRRLFGRKKSAEARPLASVRRIQLIFPAWVFALSACSLRSRPGHDYPESIKLPGDGLQRWEQRGRRWHHRPRNRVLRSDRIRASGFISPCRGPAPAEGGGAGTVYRDSSPRVYLLILLEDRRGTTGLC